MPELQLFNTLTGALEPFVPLDAEAAAKEGRAPKVSLYVCGPTVYDAAHLGHARCYITWDVLVRFLKFLGYDVTYVRNVTDVDDKILHKAAESGKTPAQVAAENYESFTADMRALNTLAPDLEPRATKAIPMMITAIEALIEKGAAYVTPDGTVYFRVASKPNYGALSKKPLEDLRAGARVDVDPDKESPVDFALWKSVDAADRTDEKLADGYCFESPWGRGRPGWHIECSAMNYEAFGTPSIDIHAGGADLIFPHHENEIAQTEAWHDLPGYDAAHPDGARFAKVWLHNGFVNVSGEKMSKSLGNFSTIQKVLARYDANTVRYFLLTNGYRMPVDFNDESLEGAENWVRKMETRLRRMNEHQKCDAQALQQKIIPTLNELNAGIAQDESYLKHLQQFHFAMQRDLDASEALAQVNQVLKLVTKDYFEIQDVYFQELVTMLSLLGFSLDFLFERVAVSDDESSALQQLIIARRQAKADKNWAEADALRDRITGQGLKILDNKDGTTSIEKDGIEIVRV